MPGQMFSLIPQQFEPIRKDLFSLVFPPSMNIQENFQVQASRPKVTNNEVELKYKNLSSWYKGKTTTETMTVVFRDAIGPGTFNKLWQWQRQHTDMSTGRGGYASTYMKTLTLNMEDPNGQVIQQFKYYNCFILSIDGGDVDMETDDIANVELTIRYTTVEQTI